MTLECIVDLYGASINRHLVSRRMEKSIGGAFKGIKTYSIELWDTKEHRALFTVQKTCHMTDGNRNTILEEIEREFVEKMFKYAFE